MRKHRFNRLKAVLIILTLSTSISAEEYSVNIKIAPTGALSEITIAGDPTEMNWILRTDGSQYPWVKENYGWGLGFFTENRGQQSIKRNWQTPVNISAGGMEVDYREGNIYIEVKRHFEANDLVEKYTFTNAGKDAVSLYDVGIYTPFNDNYPDTQTSLNLRTHTHIWAGGTAAYVNAIRMGAYAPHLGLAVTQGAVRNYEIWERGRQKENSQSRGIIMLDLPDMELKPGESYTLEWSVFSHLGNEDFYRKLLEKGSVMASANKYVVEKGETVRVEFKSAQPIKDSAVTITLNKVPVPARREGNSWIVETPMEQAGEAHFDFHYGIGKQTSVNCLVFTDIDSLIQKRIDFIRTRQTMTDPNDDRYGAFMVYDNELDSIYLNDTPNVNPVDRDEGAERVGMGILLAKQYQLTKEPELKEALVRYAKFIREKLQTKEYVTYSSVDQTNRVRGYNFVWISSFYFQMYRITGDKQYAEHGFQTLQAMYRLFGHGFYAIDIPVQLGLQTLQQAGLTKEYKKLKKDFLKTGDIFVANSLNYPPHEVNYEQSIVAPAITFLAQLYMETGIQKYLEEVHRQMPVLEAFNGLQPSFHLNEIAIRHWDGYWFGKREMFGDTFPHYWSAQTGNAFYYYAKCTGDTSYQKRAENIVRNNLCLFSEDGKASCAYMYPYKVDGVKAGFYDPFANDQDWAIVSYLLVNKNL